MELPWQDPLNRELPAGFEFGFSDCLDGYQGLLNHDGSFHTCHLGASATATSWIVEPVTDVVCLPQPSEIYIPSALERYSVTFIVLGCLFTVFGLIGYNRFRKRMAERCVACLQRKKGPRKCCSVADTVDLHTPHTEHAWQKQHADAHAVPQRRAKRSRLPLSMHNHEVENELQFNSSSAVSD